jgi:hypothetical protein
MAPPIRPGLSPGRSRTRAQPPTMAVLTMPAGRSTASERTAPADAAQAGPPRRRAGTRRLAAAPLAAALLAAAACQSPASELSSLSQRPPLDYAVMVSGGAFLQHAAAAGPGTFSTAEAAPPDTAPGRGAVDDRARPVEPLGIDEVLNVLRAGAVFQRVEVDDDAHRHELLRKLQDRAADQDLLAFLQRTRDAGFDLLLVVEQLQDNPIDAQGINGRWPVTLATWLLLGVGAFIPDHTFESGATLRVTMRDLQTGAVLFESRSLAGPIDLSLVERSNAWGLLLSLIVPPFWVHDDVDNVSRGVRDVTARRLLLSLARELKSEPTRQRLRERAVAAMGLGNGRRLTVDAAESLSAVRLRPGRGALDFATAEQWGRELLATMHRDGERFVYEAELPRSLPGGIVQVLVSTITGSVSSATFVAAEPQ